MNKTLAILTPQIGAASETFIQQHIENLLPGHTVVVTNAVYQNELRFWSTNVPMLVMNEVKWGGLNQGIINFLSCKLISNSGQNSVDWEVEKFLKKHKVNVILGEYLHYSHPYLKIAQKLNIPFFVHAHGLDISLKLREEEWKKKYLDYNQSAGIITMSQASRSKLVEFGLNPSKIFCIPYGVDTLTEPIIRSEKEVVKCLTVGRMVSKKAPILLMDSFRRAVEHYPRLHLDYVGDGPLFPAIQQFIQAFNLMDKVTLHGSQPHKVVIQLMKEADIFLQHSVIDPVTGDEEGLPVAILEAMSYSLPVVATQHSGIPEAVVHQKTGFLVSEGNSVSMSEKIVLLAQNFKLRTTMGFQGSYEVSQRFSWENEKTKLLHLINRSF